VIQGKTRRREGIKHDEEKKNEWNKQTKDNNNEGRRSTMIHEGNPPAGYKWQLCYRAGVYVL
jgi:predicted secreted protein